MNISLNKNNECICYLCKQKDIQIKINDKKLGNIFHNDINELTKLIKKCNCESENYIHKYEILLKIILSFEIQCVKCKSLYNIKITKHIDKYKNISLIIQYIIYYMIHIGVFLLCSFLLFITSKNKINNLYKHIYIFFGVVVLIINIIFLYFTINSNIKSCKNEIYNYSINISDNDKIKNEEKLFSILIEFYEWFYKKSIYNIVNDMYKNYYMNKERLNNLQKIIDKENKNNEKEAHNEIVKYKISLNLQDENIDNSKDKIITPNNINSNTNNNLLVLNKNINFDSFTSSMNNNSLMKISLNKDLAQKEDNTKKNFKDFINININPRTSKNININIHFGDRNSQLEFSSSKEIPYPSGRRFKNKIGKTVLMPKNILMANIIKEMNTFQRHNRQLKSIKVNPNQFLFNRKQINDITEDEEIDFSEFDKNNSKLSKANPSKQFLSLNRNDTELNSNNPFNSKQSYREVDFNITNSEEKG